ncbi:MAG: flagellar biosynthesis protein FliQ [Bradymonadia bacterium]|jgi:flagellar biosynthetic protein FliQ
MTSGYVISFFQEALTLAGLLSMPSLMLALIVGLIVAIFQAVTQINEQTLALIPKIVTIIAVLMITGPWMLGQLMAFTTKVFTQIATLPG